MPDWDALYLAKWLLIGLGEPRTRQSRYSFSLLKCLLNCVQTLAGPGCLCRGWRCVTCLTRLAGKGLFSVATLQPPALVRKVAVRRVSVHACLQGGGSGRPSVFPPKRYLTRLGSGLASICEPVPVLVCAGAAVRGGGLRACGSSAGSLLAWRRADGQLFAWLRSLTCHPTLPPFAWCCLNPGFLLVSLPVMFHRFAKVCSKADYKLFMGNSARRIQ